MKGIQFVTDEKDRRVAVQIDLKKYGPMLEDFWDGLISESRRGEKVNADLVNRSQERRLKRAAAAKIGRPRRHCSAIGVGRAIEPAACF
jgi:hypothetical protein